MRGWGSVLPITGLRVVDPRLDPQRRGIIDGGELTPGAIDGKYRAPLVEDTEMRPQRAEGRAGKLLRNQQRDFGIPASQELAHLATDHSHGRDHPRIGLTCLQAHEHEYAQRLSLGLYREDAAATQTRLPHGVTPRDARI